MKRILLVDIEFDKRVGDNNNNQLQTRWTHHPLGLMYLSSAVKARFPDIEFRILHSVTCENVEESVVETIDEFRPDMVGLRALSLFQKQFAAVASRVRAHAPNTFLIAGGPYASASYDDVLERDLADLVVFEEGEITFTELVAWIRARGTLPSDLAGTMTMVNGQVQVNPKRPLIDNIDHVKLPDYDLIRLTDYEGFSNHAFQSANDCVFIETSRGCPYKCFYCHVANVKTVRRRSPELVLKEMEWHYHTRDIRNFIFVDDIFNVPLKTAKAILRLVAENLPNTHLNFPNGLRADQMDDEFLDLLEACGTIQFALAIETATPRLQKLCGKLLKLDRTHTMVDKASRRFVVGTFNMMGFPTETKEEALATIKFAEDLTYVSQPVMSIVRVYPGTPLFTAMDATKEQARRLEQQTAEALQPHLHGDPSFYGDIFSNEQVPLTAEDIAELRWEWVKRVVNNPDRILNSHKVIQRHLNPARTIEFYRNFFDNPNFSQKRLDSMLKTAERGRTAREHPTRSSWPSVEDTVSLQLPMVNSK